MQKVAWEVIEPVLRPHATVANGRELYWIGWCWQILDHKELTRYETGPELAMVLMRAISLMRVQKDYAFIMLTIEPDWDEQVLFTELCTATGCTEKATMRWEQKRIMPVLIDAYVEWSPLVNQFDPGLASEYGWSVDEFLEDLKKTLPPENADECVYALYPSCYHHELADEADIETLEQYHAWLDDVRESHANQWIENNWILPKIRDEYAEGVRLYFHASWQDVEELIRRHLCWGTEEEVDWYREMWKLLDDNGFAAYHLDLAEVIENVIGLIYTYHSFCMLALDRPISIMPEVVMEELVEWPDTAARENVQWEPNQLVPTLVSLLANAKGYRRTGRFGRLRIDECDVFLNRGVSTLPITDKSLTRHYRSESAWRFDNPTGSDLKAYNEGLFQQRMERLRAWIISGTLDPDSSVPSTGDQTDLD